MKKLLIIASIAMFGATSQAAWLVCSATGDNDQSCTIQAERPMSPSTGSMKLECGFSEGDETCVLVPNN